jgi:hypothetical protein
MLYADFAEELIGLSKAHAHWLPSVQGSGNIMRSLQKMNAQHSLEVGNSKGKRRIYLRRFIKSQECN